MFWANDASASLRRTIFVCAYQEVCALFGDGFSVGVHSSGGEVKTEMELVRLVLFVLHPCSITSDKMHCMCYPYRTVSL